MRDTIYDGKQHSLPGFRAFLDHIATRQLLPPWWSPEKREECERLAMDGTQWHNLYTKLHRGDVIKTYGDTSFPMQLRMFGESVFMRGVGGVDGTEARRLLAEREGTDGMAAVLDMLAMEGTDEMEVLFDQWVSGGRVGGD